MTEIANSFDNPKFDERAWALVTELAEASRAGDARRYLEISRSVEKRFPLREQSIAAFLVAFSLRIAVIQILTRRPEPEDLPDIAALILQPTAAILKIDADLLRRALLSAHEIEYSGEQVKGARLFLFSAAMLGALLQRPEVDLRAIRASAEDWWRNNANAILSVLPG